MSKDLIAPCGLYCGWCPYYIVGTKEFTCKGCQDRIRCPISSCAKVRGLEPCTYCQEFPCQKLYEMYGHMHQFFEDIKKDFPQGIKKPE